MGGKRQKAEKDVDVEHQNRDRARRSKFTDKDAAADDKL